MKIPVNALPSKVEPSRTMLRRTIAAALALGIPVPFRPLVGIRVPKLLRWARRTVSRAVGATANYALAVMDGCNDLLHRLRQPNTAACGWIGVDLDGTLAEYHGWKGIEHIDRPVP